MMSRKIIVVVETVEAVSSSRLARVVRTVQIGLYTLRKCEVMTGDTTNPSD